MDLLQARIWFTSLTPFSWFQTHHTLPLKTASDDITSADTSSWTQAPGKRLICNSPPALIWVFSISIVLLLQRRQSSSLGRNNLEKGNEYFLLKMVSMEIGEVNIVFGDHWKKIRSQRILPDMTFYIYFQKKKFYENTRLKFTHTYLTNGLYYEEQMKRVKHFTKWVKIPVNICYGDIWSK